MLPSATVTSAAPAATYRSVLRAPYATRLLLSTLLGRLPSGMAPLAVVLAGADRDSYGAAGVLAAVYLVANAAGGPPLGRLADRLGQPSVLTVSAVVASASFGLLLADRTQLLGAVVAGLARPPLDATLRATLPRLMPDRAHERVAFSLEAAAQELIYIVGPLLVAGLASLVSAQAALMATAAAGLAGTLLVVSTPPARAFKPRPRAAGWLGPLRHRGLRRLYAAMACAALPMGAIVPVAVSYAERLHAPTLAGLLPAVVSVGAVAGGLAYGTRSWPGSMPLQLTVLCAGWAAGWLPLLAITGRASVVAACLLPGVVMAPLLGTASLITARLAPEGMATEASALLVAALDVGCAMGTAAAVLPVGVWLLPAGGAAALALLIGPALRRPRLPQAAAPPVREAA
ncbi:MFS transporter [Streptomyces sp. NPDC005799]|uniref:MFS transporter n=1 Tax=Streptomyces sp. NPDC005799 TaxID=3154678 RepID=UPI0033F40AC6